MQLSMRSKLRSLPIRSDRVLPRCPPAIAILGSRRFHLSTLWQVSTPEGPRGGTDPTASDTANDLPPIDSSVIPTKDGQTALSTPTPAPRRHWNRGAGPYGSGVRRAMRNRKLPQKEVLPETTVPDWFYERNVVSYNGADHPGSLHESQQVTVEPFVVSREEPVHHDSDFITGCDGGIDNGPRTPSDSNSRYVLSQAVWEELCASVNAGLRLPAADFADEPAATKAHLILQYPGSNGTLFLNAIIRRLVYNLGAKLISLNAQDIAELCSEQDRADSGISSSIRSLGYEVYRSPRETPWQESDDGTNEEDREDSETEASGPTQPRPDLNTSRFLTIDGSRELSNINFPNWLDLRPLVASFNGPALEISHGGNASRSTINQADHRWLSLINGLISPSLTKKRVPGPKDAVSASSLSEEQRTDQPPTIIIQIQDYKDIQGTGEGSKFLSLLQQVIQTLRRKGSRVLLIGTVTRHGSSFVDRESPRLIPNTYGDHFAKTLVITPAMDAQTVERVFTEDRKKLTMDINIRHLQDMVRTRLNDHLASAEGAIFQGRMWALNPVMVRESGLEERFWNYNHVHRVVTLALGCTGPEERLGLRHIERGLAILEQADRIRNAWLQDHPPKAPASGLEAHRQALPALRKKCNTHEKKLLSGVVDVNSIRTTFADVHVPPETIDALKTLTTLSLIRPEAFTYGVLATDRIPGLLLYGPPGTGKTLLAKAVARESGATVLEVSGSEVYDMYVGEGEKNVKAIFTLAKKLSPCVVFIDEADAILCSRTGATGRISHRELINQFLREWDGMNDVSAFIMVATNRPFDLDDAVLRRLPRRLLVDLPTEQDRQSILGIHLKGELLDQSVDLADLAQRTPLYSGSDLKNLCVAAALACVREENELAARHHGEPFQYPARRTLNQAHFERGMEEISASISEDMSSLAAIRRFDEKYGDRKGRRRKGNTWGFASLEDIERTVDNARVRT